MTGAAKLSVAAGEMSPATGAAPPLQALRFAGVSAPVILPQDPDLTQALLGCMRNWPGDIVSYAPGDPLPGPPLGVIEPRGRGRYRAHSRFLEQPLDDLAAATAVCVVLADLSQAYSEADATHAFGLHCGCVTLGTHGLILAGERRAGKSTLVARLSAEPEVRVLCDDVLPIATDGTALALGLAPRLRLPLPEGASPLFRAHVDRWLGPADDRYGYLLPPGLLPHGTRVPANVLLVLDRQAEGRARLHRLPADEVLHHVLQRSITGPEGADATFAAAERLTGRLAGLRLVYSDLEDAVALLRAAFGTSALPTEAGGLVLPALPQGPSVRPDAGPLAVAPRSRFRRVKGVSVRRVGEAAFLWRPGEAILWHLNPVARALWTLLTRPASASEMADVLTEAFPDEDPERLLADVARLLARLQAEDLVVPAR